MKINGMKKKKTRISLRVRRVSYAEVLFVVASLLWFTVYKKTNMIAVAMVVATMGFFGFSFVENEKAALYSLSKTRFYIYIVLSFMVGLYDLILYGVVRFMQTIVRLLALYSAIYMFEYSRQAYSFERNKSNARISMITFMILTILQLHLYISSGYDYARVAVSRNGALFSFFSSPYGLAYASAFLSIVLLEKILVAESCGTRVKYSILFVINVMLVLYTKSMLTSIGLVLCLFFVFLNNMIKLQSKNQVFFFDILVVVLFILFVLVVRQELGAILLKLSGDNELNAYVRKLREIAKTLIESAYSENMYARVDAYSASLSSIVRHPVLGSYLWGRELENAVGNHSELLDTFSNYGIIYGTLLFSTLYYNMKRVYEKNHIVSGIHIAFSFYIALVNPIHHYVSYFALFYLAPALAENWY